MYAFRFDTSKQVSDRPNKVYPRTLHANGKTQAGEGEGRDEVESRAESVEGAELLVGRGHGGGWLWVSGVSLKGWTIPLKMKDGCECKSGNKGSGIAHCHVDSWESEHIVCPQSQLRSLFRPKRLHALERRI